MAHMTIIRKLTLLLLALLLISTLTGAAILRANGQIRSQAKESETLGRLEREYESLMMTYHELNTISYRFLSEGYEKKQAQAYTDKLESLRTTAGKLSAELEGSAELGSYLNWFAKLNTDYEALYADHFTGTFLPESLNSAAILQSLTNQTTAAGRIDRELKDIFGGLREERATQLGDTLANSSRTAIWLTIGTVVLSVALAYLFGRSVNRGVGMLIRRIEAYREGRLDYNSSVVRSDEFGRVDLILAQMGERIREMLEANRDTGRKVVSWTGSLLEKSRDNREASDSIQRLAESCQVRIESLHEATASISAVVQQASAGSEQLREAAGTLRNSVEKTNGYAQEGKQAVLELAASFERTSEELVRLGGQVGSIAERMDDALRFMSGIGDLAYRTNLLSLNASIEASRAGAQGGGFSVIAREIRKLAGQTESFAKQTRTLMDAMRSDMEGMSGGFTQFTVRLEETKHKSELAVGSFLDIAGESQTLAVGTEEWSRAAAEVAAGLDEIVVSVARLVDSSADLRDGVVRVSGIALRQADLSGHLLQAADELAEVSAALQRDEQ
ncbi:hypothetical protein B1A99_04315 [Cohnella sp. CIP 111063]|nr:hypothetical protein B1A99_04315 [Cohnella sp. CIP 111063]